MYIETLFETRLLILLDAMLRLGLQCIIELLLTMNRPNIYIYMHLRDRKLKTCKLVCMQTMRSGIVRALGHHLSPVYIIKGLS